MHQNSEPHTPHKCVQMCTHHYCAWGKLRAAGTPGKVSLQHTDTNIMQCKRSVCGRVFVCVCVCVCGYSRFYQVFPVGPVWPHWRPRVGSLPNIAGLRCRPGVHPCIAPRPVRYALRPEPGSLPQDHPGSGVVAPWLPPGQLHGNSSTSPSSPCHPVCCVCIGVFTAGGARGSEAASMADSIWRFPQKGCPERTAATARLQTCPIRGSIPQPFGCETYA